MNEMNDLISRQAILKHIEKIRQDVQFMDDTRSASIIMNGMNLCEEAVMNQPSAQSDWDEMLVICDNCGHAIHVKRLQGESDET